MAAKTFKLEIVTPEQIVLNQDSSSVVVPGSEGSLGILADHAPLMAELKAGVVYMKDADGNETTYAISGGFMEVNSNTVRILADTAEPGSEIDIERAEAALRRAEERLRAHDAAIDMTRAEIALKRALARLQAAQHH
ncbi:MAG: F0F1 ATP synthase subunit epsilon [Armatimonadota bacterium]